ncbi:DUF5709 domain-containing protein [Kitasatospora sp. NBC_01250]|uniref:DUF5709 domain-containing protein n=1 Tax=unclassified Kitasatospora TaxID=2633591 RepID=UPI002E14E1F5|nr:MULTISPECIES: DUF5709 domain-containing protein [unclassified Kitasatospora]WSJ70754.1 DUF5709 domain-containing protein [Kitasatospora sp. NBC_01302]
MGREDDRAMGDDVYQPDGSEVTDDTGILDPEDTLSAREADPYDEGWSPPERPLAVEQIGTTAQEQVDGESLDQRLAKELPDPALQPPGEETDGIGDASDTDGEPVDGEVGDLRAGRLVTSELGVNHLLAQDVGIDGAAASAEEAAMHVIAEESDSVL